MADNQSAHQDAVDTVKDLIKDIKVAMLTTVADGKLVSRPMSTQEVEFDGELWFITKKDTETYRDINENPNVNVSYVDKNYVSITGTAEFVQDDAKKKEYWNYILGRVLDTNADDPDVVLIKVTPEWAEYWESGLKFKTVKEFAKKTVSRKTMDEGNNLKHHVDFDQNNRL